MTLNIFSSELYISAPLIAVFRRVKRESVPVFVEKLVSTGFPLIEVTMDSPDWLEISREISAVGGIWGAGTVTSPSLASQAHDAGAHFMMSPVCDPEVITAGLATGVPFVPGCMTPSEINTAIKLGARAVKVFPAVSVGTEGLASLRGPFPEIPIIATGGVSLTNAVDYLKAGATFVGIGTSLFRDLSKTVTQLEQFHNQINWRSTS